MLVGYQGLLQDASNKSTASFCLLRVYNSMQVLRCVCVCVCLRFIIQVQTSFQARSGVAGGPSIQYLRFLVTQPYQNCRKTSRRLVEGSCHEPRPVLVYVCLKYLILQAYSEYGSSILVTTEAPIVGPWSYETLHFSSCSLSQLVILFPKGPRTQISWYEVPKAIRGIVFWT